MWEAQVNKDRDEDNFLAIRGLAAEQPGGAIISSCRLFTLAFSF